MSAYNRYLEKSRARDRAAAAWEAAADTEDEDATYRVFVAAVRAVDDAVQEHLRPKRRICFS